MSVLYKLDVRAKLIFVLLFTILAFTINNIFIAVWLLLSLILIRIAFKVPFREFKLTKNVVILAILIILMQTLFGPGETYIFKFGQICLKLEGLIFGLLIVCRIAILLLLLPVFTLTTALGKITAALYSMGFNYKTAFIITFAFNLIPFFKEEALLIMDTQKLRGKQTPGITGYAGLMVPLMLNAMRKAQASAIAMDCRAFGVYKTRTWIDLPQMKTHDFLFIFTCIVYFTFVIFYNYK